MDKRFNQYMSTATERPVLAFFAAIVSTVSKYLDCQMQTLIVGSGDETPSEPET